MRAPLLLLVLWLVACSGPQQKPETAVDDQVPLVVTVDSCDEAGRPVVNDVQVLKLPGDKLYWVFAKRDDTCRIFGAILNSAESREPDECDIRFRSKEALPPVVGVCACRPGKFALQEGRPTSTQCCEKYPDSIHCKDR